MTHSSRMLRNRITVSAPAFPELQWNQTAISSQEVLRADFSGQAVGRFPAWFGNVRERIEELSQRGEGWDSYGGDPLREDAANSLLAVLSDLRAFIQSEPTISLTNEGGLVAEWESSQSALEMVATGPDVHVYYCEEASQREWEMAAAQCQPLDKWLWRASSSM